MSKRDKYAPDYGKLYPGVQISPEVMRVLTGSDRKMKYCEYDLKTERLRKNARTSVVTVYPAREDSLDRLAEEGRALYAPEEASPEDTLMEQDELERLRYVLKMLTPKEYSLIHALYYENLSEREYAKKIGIASMTVHNQKVRAIAKIKKMLENKK